jgi:hypothetical protein
VSPSRRAAIIALACVFAPCLSSLSSAARAATRLAVVVGNNVGGPDDPTLRFAQSDAARIAQILTTLGDFAASDVALLEGRGADEMRAAISSAEARLLREGPDGVLFVFYSGHADAEGLHLGGTTFPLDGLESLVGRSEVATRVMVVDACRSGMLTQTKGGRQAASFDVRLSPPANPRGLAIITSSASGEEAQESGELGASFFTHHFAAALLGAADQDGDGAVTLGEAFAYAARHTVAATALTRAGPQHPTFKLSLGGREELVLTRPGLTTGVGHLVLTQPGWYMVRRKRDDAVIAEITNDGVARPLALAPARYEVVRRADDRVEAGTFEVEASGQTTIHEADLRRVEFGRVVRKGGTTRARAIAVFASAAVRGPLLDLGDSWGGGVGARADLRAFTVTSALDIGSASRTSDRATRLETTELGVRLAGLRAFDLPFATFGLGAELGLRRFSQSASDQPAMLSGASFAASLGPTAFAEIPLARRLLFWLQATAPTYFMRVEDPSPGGATRGLHTTYLVAAAVGAYL